MNSLHSHSVLSATYELPVLSRPAQQPCGIIFGECKAGAGIHFDKDVPFHMLFLLKGAACVKLGGKEIDVFPNEFLVVDSSLPLKGECVCSHRSHYVIITLDKPLHTGTDISTAWTSGQPHTIPAGLYDLLRYMLPAMPPNERLNHYMIPRIVCSILRRYGYT